MQIGKNGFEKALPEIKARLEKKPVLRIKVNKPLVEGRMRDFTQEIAEMVSAETGTKIEMVRGRTFVIRKVKKK